MSDAVTINLHAGAEAPAEVRALVDTLPVRLSHEQRYDMRLALSELVANSVRHGTPLPGRSVEVSITTSDACIHCEVADQGEGFRLADVREDRPRHDGGLGLILLDRVATRWGLLREGRTVWFELERAG